MTRGRHANIAHIYERATEASEFSQEQRSGTHVARRGDSRDAVTLLRGILANDEPAITAHDYATHTPEEALPDRVRSLLTRRAAATQRRQADYQAWATQRQEHDRHMEEAQQRHIDRSQHRTMDYGIEI